MRSAVILAAAALATVATAAPARAWHYYHWPHFAHSHPHTYPQRPRAAAPLAAPIQFQLPFGFGINVPQLQIQGPLGNRVDIGQRETQETQQPRITIAESTKKEIRDLNSDLDRLLGKANKLSEKMYAPQDKTTDPVKRFEEIKREGSAKPSGGSGGNPGGMGGAAEGKGKDKGGKATPPEDD